MTIEELLAFCPQAMIFVLDNSISMRWFFDRGTHAHDVSPASYDAASLETALRHGLALGTPDVELIAACRFAGVCVV